MVERILRRSELAAALGVSATTLWRIEREPGFPKARILRHGGRVGFLESEINDFLRSRPQADETTARARIAPAMAARGLAPEKGGDA